MFVLSWAGLQFSSFAACWWKGFPYLPEPLTSKGNLWLAPAGCRDQALKGEKILHAGLSCLLLSKSHWFNRNKCTAAASHVSVLDKEKAQMLVLLPLMSFYLALLSASILDQAQVNLSSWALSKPHFQGHLFYFLLEWRAKCFQVNL